MKRINKIVFLYTLGGGLILMNSTLKAQSFKERIEQWRQDMSSTESLYAKLRIEALSDEDAEPVYEQSIEWKKSGDKFLYNMGDTETFSSSEGLVIINRAEKTILFRPITEDEWEVQKKAIATAGGLNLDSLLTIYEKVEAMGVKNGLEHYRLFHKEEMITQTDVFFKQSDGKIQQIDYRYDREVYPEGFKVEIKFTEFSLNPPINTKELMLSNYVTKKDDGSYLLNRKWRNNQYQLEVVEADFLEKALQEN